MSLAPAAACYMQCCLWVSRKSKCSLAAVGVSVGQMINCALALKAVNSRAINSDESTKTCLWILWKQWKGKDVHLWFTPYSINSLPFICYFFFLLLLHCYVCILMCVCVCRWPTCYYPSSSKLSEGDAGDRCSRWVTDYSSRLRVHEDKNDGRLERLIFI